MLRLREIPVDALPDPATLNAPLRRKLLAQGDDGITARGVYFGFRRARLFAVRPDQLRDALEGTGLGIPPPGAARGIEGEVVLSIEASPYAPDFDRFDAMVTRIAARQGWLCLGWSTELRERL